MSNDTPILVTGVPGNIGSVGGSVVKLLRERDLPVRALVLHLDERSQTFIKEFKTGVEVVVADLTNGRSKSVARLQADVFWHECIVTLSSSYGYCSSRSKRNPRL
jgi:NAD(P)H dehydrogenase (quinone)